MRKHDLDVLVTYSGAIGLICRILFEDGKVDEVQKFYKQTDETDESIINRADAWAVDRIHALEARDSEADSLKGKIESLSTMVKGRKK